MGNWWDDAASDLQYSVKVAEQDIEIDYSEEEVRQAIVHTRQDVVMLVSHFSSLHKQLRTVSIFCFFIVLVLVFILIKI
jgi:hypothetical protein